MKGIILYKSKYGATKRYAQWLSEETGFEIRENSKVRVSDVKEYDVLILGGGIYASGVAGLELYTFPESDWAVFNAKGPMPGSLQTLNTAVWQEWFPNDGQKYKANGTATLEVYSAGNPQSLDYECGIWVPVMGMDKSRK